MSVAMSSPMPRRAVEVSGSMPTSPVPWSPTDLDAPELNNPRPFWYDTTEQCDVEDDEATQELRDLLGPKSWTKMLPDWSPAFDTRCLSSASTNAMSPMPPLSSISPASTPDRDLVAPATPAKDTEAPSDERPQCPPGALDKSSWLQARKVFVGGIPQTVDQNALYHMFSKVGKVKKAWIQLFHSDRGTAQTSTAKMHRGFGFVIFHDRQSIDGMLGKDFSRFVCFGDDLKLEVKRSVGKASQEETKGQKSELRSKNADIAPHGTPSRQISPSTPQMLQGDLPTPSRAFHSAPYPVVYQMCQSPAPPTPQTWNNVSPAAPQAFVVAYSMPFVPAFPFPGVAQSQCNSSPMCASPMMCQPSPAGQEQSSFQLIPNCLFDGFVGQKPQNSEELQKALKEALPERYDD